jgi:hypothetical protein
VGIARQPDTDSNAPSVIECQSFLARRSSFLLESAGNALSVRDHRANLVPQTLHPIEVRLEELDVLGFSS